MTTDQPTPTPEDREVEASMDAELEEAQRLQRSSPGFHLAVTTLRRTLAATVTQNNSDHWGPTEEDLDRAALLGVLRMLRADEQARARETMERIYGELQEGVRYGAEAAEARRIVLGEPLSREHAQQIIDSSPDPAPTPTSKPKQCSALGNPQRGSGVLLSCELEEGHPDRHQRDGWDWTLDLTAPPAPATCGQASHPARSHVCHLQAGHPGNHEGRHHDKGPRSMAWSWPRSPQDTCPAAW